MTKPDDSSLTPKDLEIIEKQAARLLDKADAWDRYPVPVDDILGAANVRLASHSIFDASGLLSYLKGKTNAAQGAVKSAMSKVFGLYDASEETIHVDETVVESKQNFLKLHETGHHDIPTHRKMFRFFQDCAQCLSPDVADQFEREANNFARYALFKGETFAEQALDYDFEIKTPMKLAKRFGASVYASVREYARTNQRACVVYALEPIEFVEGHGAVAKVRRIEPSPSFVLQFGRPSCTSVTLEHVLGEVLPIGRKMTRPTSIQLTDRNGTRHECLAEAFDSTYNVFILVYPVKDLTSTVVDFSSALSF